MTLLKATDAEAIRRRFQAELADTVTIQFFTASAGGLAVPGWEYPRVLTAIRLRYVAEGPGLRVEPVEKAVALSQEKYRSVSAMLRKAAPITYETAVIDTLAAHAALPAHVG